MVVETGWMPVRLVREHRTGYHSIPKPDSLTVIRDQVPNYAQPGAGNYFVTAEAFASAVPRSQPVGRQQKKTDLNNLINARTP